MPDMIAGVLGGGNFNIWGVVEVANEQNLVPLDRRTKKEQREITSKGGKASVKARQMKKALKEYMITLLASPADEEAKKELAGFGFDVSELDRRAQLVLSAYKTAVERGDVAAFKEILKLIGEGGDDIDANKLDININVVDRIEKGDK